MRKDSSKVWRNTRKNLFNIKIHFIFLTKYKGNVLNQEILDKLNCIFKKICEQMKSELILFEGKNDYIHLLVLMNPTISISVFAGKLKGTSSHLIVKEFKEQLEGKVLDKQFWAPSYAVVSDDDESSKYIKKFLESQN